MPEFSHSRRGTSAESPQTHPCSNTSGSADSGPPIFVKMSKSPQTSLWTLTVSAVNDLKAMIRLSRVVSCGQWKRTLRHTSATRSVSGSQFDFNFHEVIVEVSSAQTDDDKDVLTEGLNVSWLE